MNFYREIVRPLLFTVDPEAVHDVIMNYAHELQKYPTVVQTIHHFNGVKKQDSVKLWNLEFPNKVGLAAGFDKNAKSPWFWWMLGFGFIEIGGITQFPQPGNAMPRIFRLKKDQAIINRMGFNNDGAEMVVHRLEILYRTIGKPNMPIGVNIGKNKFIENNLAPETFAYTFHHLYDVCDFFVVNVSSPNTPNLRKLQDSDSLRKIFESLYSVREKQYVKKPILLKIAPDLSDFQVEEIIDLTSELRLDGLVVSNTTLSRNGLVSPKNLTSQTGGLSGKPVKKRSTEMIRMVRNGLADIPIIGVGGIFSADDAKEKCEAGANLIQLYTGFIYEGPNLVREIVNAGI